VTLVGAACRTAAERRGRLIASAGRGSRRCASGSTAIDQPERPARLELARRLPGPKSVWLVGGDGWAFDIGFGGLDHVLSMHLGRERAGPRHRASTRTPVARQSKATPLGAAAKFAAAGKEVDKKDLGLMAMSLRPCLRRAASRSARATPRPCGRWSRPIATPARAW
jgi:hypothetical protein